MSAAEVSILGNPIVVSHETTQPIIEIQFADYTWPAFLQLRNEIATVRKASRWK